ncbi:MAG TPA: hypothetical protein VEM40_00160 [Nitrospirota bacterium]|nr:hypothetical protein [Nitrospirota bacterium]
MNKQRKRILVAYIAFLFVILFFSFIIIGYAVYQKHISSFEDIFYTATNEEESIWIRLAIVALINLFVFSSIIFFGLLIFFRKKENRDER